MLKNKGAILALLGLVSLIPIGSLYSFIVPHDIYRNSHEYKTYNPFNDEYMEQSAERVTAHYTRILDEITIGLLVVGFAQAILFLWQLAIINKSLADTKEAADAARDSAKASGDAVTLARQSAETQLRAYMSVKRATISNVVVDKIPEIEIETINSGRTPAYKVCITHQYFLAYFPFREEITQPEKESSSTIGPGLTLLALAKGTTPLSFEHLAGIRKGTLAIYVVGQVTYEDAFAQNRTNNFRFFVGGKKGFPPNNAMYADMQGNDAD